MSDQFSPIEPVIFEKELNGFYYDRIIKVNFQTIDQNLVTQELVALDLSELRVKFEGIKTIKAELDRVKITLLNLSEDTAGIILKTGLNVELIAGYRFVQGGGLLFSGQIQKISFEDKGDEKLTHIQCYDGVNVFKSTYVGLSFSKNTPVKNAIDRIRAALKIPYYPGSERALTALGNFNKGFQYSGPCEWALKELADQYVFNYEVINNNLRIFLLPETEQRLRFLFNPFTGLINTPEILTKNDLSNTDLKPKARIRLKVLLNNMVQVGDQIRVQWGGVKNNKWQIDEVFNVVTHKFMGTNYNNEFYSVLEAETLPTNLDIANALFGRGITSPEF